MSFWIDYSRDIDVEYDELLLKLLNEGINNTYINEVNPFNVFLKLLRNFLNLKPSIILDSDFSEKEILDLGITNDDIKDGEYNQDDFSGQFNSINDVIFFYEKNKENLSIDIYTSGTTGRPKKVSQSYKNLIRGVKCNESFRENIWGFAYNPTHFGGIQVFLQAFYNKNELVYLFNLDYIHIYQSILERKITHLSCTPTFMKILLGYITEPIFSIRSLTFGGEKFDINVLKQLKVKFPKAKIKNVYASTEAGSLFRADGEFFIIPKRIKEHVKIINDELYIHNELLGKSDSFELEGGWYKTGDIVDYVDENRFYFKSRKSEIINVGGYKVNPNEIEGVIKAVEGVKDVSVFGRDNSIMGQIIVANVIKEEGVEDAELKQRIKEVCKSELQNFKIPRLIKFVNMFNLTRTGKIKKI
jgi:acyl-CoA synthetase (AMP-forming)/AMP-acid ligase II